ncbi:uncharacterized protein LOC144104592 isoform X1 [Amblyomma americanum]
MADPAKTENTTDTTLLRPLRRSSILKPNRPPFEDITLNVTLQTREPGEKRRLSKRVSFSDTHEIKLFNRDQSGELGSSADNVLANAKVPTPGAKTDDPASSKGDTVSVQARDHHDALEQSFYCNEDDAGNRETVCPSQSTLIFMEDALSCLVFNGAGSVDAVDQNSSSACPNRTTVAAETMDLTCANASSVAGQLAADCTGAVDRNASSACLSKTGLADKTMDMTCANTSVLGPIPTDSADRNASIAGLNKTTLDHKTMDLTVASASPVLDQMTTDLARAAGSSSTSGWLNKTMLTDKTMDMTGVPASPVLDQMTTDHARAAGSNSTSGWLNKTMVTDKTMDLTGVLASPVLDQVTTDRARAAGRNPTSRCLNKTMLTDKTMDLTGVPASPVLDQVTTDHARAAGRDCTSGRLNKTVLIHESMDVTCAVPSAVEQMPEDSTAMHQGASSICDVSVHPLETMNVTCASDVVDLATDATMRETDVVAAGHIYQAASGDAAVQSMSAVFKDIITEDACDVAKPAQQLDLASFVAVARKFDARDALGDDDSPVRTASNTSTMGDAAGVANPVVPLSLASFFTATRKFNARDALGDDDSPVRTVCDTAAVRDAAVIANPVVPFSLASITQTMQTNDSSNIRGNDGNDKHHVMGVSAAVLDGATRFSECPTSADTTEAPEMSGVILPPAVDISLATNYQPVTMNITGLDVSGRGMLSSAALLSGSDLSSAKQNAISNEPCSAKRNGSWTAMQPRDAEHMASCRMSLTCAFTGSLDNDRPPPAAPLLADVTCSSINHEQSIGPTSHNGKVLGEDAGNGDSFNLSKTCLMSVSMDATCASTAAAVITEQHVADLSGHQAGLTHSNDSCSAIKACKHLCKRSEEAIDPGNLMDLDGAANQCSRAHGNDLNGSNESARDSTGAAGWSANMTAGLVGGMTRGEITVEPTLTSAPLLMPGSFLDDVAAVEPIEGNISFPDAIPRESPLPDVGTVPSFEEATPGHKATDEMRCIEERAVITPVRPASSEGGERKDMTSLKKRLAAEVDGISVLSGKDSIALQQMVSPVSNASRMPRAVSSSKSKSLNAASKNDFSALRRKFDAFLDSTGNRNISGLDGLDVSALLATTADDVDSISGDASFPHTAQGKVNVHDNGGSALESSSKGRKQQPNGTRSSCLMKSPGRDCSVNSGNGADVGRTASQVPAVEGEILADSKPSKKGIVRKSGESCSSKDGCNSNVVIDVVHDVGSARRVSASLEGERRSTRATACLSKNSMGNASGSGDEGDRTDSVAKCDAARKSETFVESGKCTRRSKTFVVPTKDARPGATFTVLSSPGCDVACIDSSAAGENAAEKSELLPAPANVPSASSAPCRCSAKKHIAGACQSSDKISCDQSAATTKFRKRLDFTELKERPRGVEAGSATCDNLKLGLSSDAHTASSSRALSEPSDQFSVSGRSRSPCSKLHTSSAGSLSKIRQQHRGLSYVGSDEEMLMDVPEPSLVMSSPTTSSVQAVQRDSGTTSEQVTSPEGREKITLVNGHISTSLFYSSSTAKKRSKPPSTPSSRPSESGRSKAKKHRSGKSGAKSGDCNCRRTPASSGRKRRASPETPSTDKCKHKAKGGHASVRGAANKSQVADQEEMAVSKKQRNSWLSFFARNLKLRSLPPTPPGLLENIVNAGLPEPRDFAGVQSKDAAETKALPKLPDICEPVVFDTAEVDLTAGIDINDILDRLDDKDALESIYWSFTELPQESVKQWELRAIEMEPHKAVFGFIKDQVKLTVSLGDFVRQPGSTDKDALFQRTAGAVPRRSKHISALKFQTNCSPRALFNQYIINKRFLDTFKTAELLKRYPTTDCLGKMLGELGAFFVRHGPLCRDIGFIARFCPYTFDYPVLSIHIMHPRRLIWFHMDLLIDLDTYPHAEILPSSRPYSDEYHVIRTEKLRRITAHVKPGPQYIRRMVEEIEAFMEK